jgi:hypothetical protein
VLKQYLEAVRGERPPGCAARRSKVAPVSNRGGIEMDTQVGGRR